MTQHLLLVTLGPVQDFIAQARRTRDLWCGSHLVSELSRAAARALANGGAKLIFPALCKDDPELEPCHKLLRANRQPPLSIANKLLAEVPSDTDPQELACATRDAVMLFWRDELAGEVRKKCRGLLADGIDLVWAEQIDSFIEFAATWTPLNDYARSRQVVEQSLAARKHLRDFGQWQHLRGNVPKSSLDGARETVLSTPERRVASLVRKYRIEPGEQLDAVGLVKRAGEEPDQFVPIVNVALMSWIELASREALAKLEELKSACSKLDIAPIRRPNLPCAKKFPFDASILLRNRLKPLFKELELGDDRAAEDWGRSNLDPLLRILNEPCPYVACLVADGDRVGKAIESLALAETHRTFSRRLAGFAGEAREIVEQRHSGSLIYSGGDDVLGFLPLPEALTCADALRRRFVEIMTEACSDAVNERPTLSVGIGVGHVMESMGDLLALGRDAEKLAKHGDGKAGDRNALAIIVDKRSGGRRSWRANWDQSMGDPVARLLADARLLEERLSSRKVYEIARTLRRLPKPLTTDDPAWCRVLALEVRRSLARVNAEQSIEPEEVGLVLGEGAGYKQLYGTVSAWVDRMLVARSFAEAVPTLKQRLETAA